MRSGQETVRPRAIPGHSGKQRGSPKWAVFLSVLVCSAADDLWHRWNRVSDIAIIALITIEINGSVEVRK
jgi:hypothetical protein